MNDEERKRQTGWDSSSLRDLIQQLAPTDIDELEIADGDTRLLLRRIPRVSPAQARPAVVGVEIEERGLAVIAPLAGVFYSRPSPDQPPFISIGDRVQAGHVVALIETMKLFNEVTSDVEGEILSIHARDGDLVETDQVLFYVAPGGGEPASGHPG